MKFEANKVRLDWFFTILPMKIPCNFFGMKEKTR